MKFPKVLLERKYFALFPCWNTVRVCSLKTNMENNVVDQEGIAELEEEFDSFYGDGTVIDFLDLPVDIVYLLFEYFDDADLRRYVFWNEFEEFSHNNSDANFYWLF